MSETTVRVRLDGRGRGPSRGAGAKRPRRPAGSGRRAPRRGDDRAARLLALAHHLERLVEEGRLRDYAHAADVLGLTRARVTQVMNLLVLAPEVQAAVVLGMQALPERALRRACAEPEWNKQVDLIQEVAA